MEIICAFEVKMLHLGHLWVTTHKMVLVIKNLKKKLAYLVTLKILRRFRKQDICMGGGKKYSQFYLDQ